jgi:hypothetical protein
VTGGPGGGISWVLVDTTTYTATTLTPSYSSGITALQQTKQTTLTTNKNTITNNSIYVDQVGDNNSISIDQKGNFNELSGITQARAKMWGNNNTYTIKQGDQTDLVGKNLIKLEIDGALNTLSLYQGRDANGSTDGSESGGHIQQLLVSGSSNTITTRQSNDAGANSGHLMVLDVTGSLNTVTANQLNNNSKTLFAIVNGNSNSVTANQSGTGAHYLDINLTGNGHTVDANQSGAGNHATTLNLTNAGGSGNITVNQSGTTAQVYSLTQSCTNSAGCPVTITQY